ncbi:hypothetical protein HDE_05843 [Halotydeus destructor]|nr:hypothetical protein HDE_05843 [Halotydeus destructor]
MWWEIVPAASLVTAFLALPSISVPTIHYIFMGKPCKRGPINQFEKDMWRRDQKLDPFRGNGLGDGHNTVGLEGIPDGKPFKR